MFCCAPVAVFCRVVLGILPSLSKVTAQLLECPCQSEYVALTPREVEGEREGEGEGAEMLCFAAFIVGWLKFCFLWQILTAYWSVIAEKRSKFAFFVAPPWESFCCLRSAMYVEGDEN